MKSYLYLAALLTLFLAACSPNETAEVKEEAKKNVSFDIRGTWVSDNEYTNPFFNLAIDIPEGWSLKKGSSKQLEDSASELFADNDQALQETVKSAIENTYTAFWAHRHPVGTQGKTNPNVTLMIENVKNTPIITSAKDYLMAMANTLKMVREDISFVEQPGSVDMGGLEFWKREVVMPVDAFKVYQDYYVMKKGDYVLLIGVSTVSEDDKRTVSQLTNSIRRLAD